MKKRKVKQKKVINQQPNVENIETSFMLHEALAALQEAKIVIELQNNGRCLESVLSAIEYLYKILD